MPNTPDFELVYFNLDGRGMQIRLLFDLTETPFSDRRISRAEWTKFKGSTPWGFLPVLHHHGSTLFDSVSITAYVARQVGLWPDDPADQARSLAIMNAVDDVWVHLQGVGQAWNPLARLWRIKKVIRHDLPELCGKIENQLAGDFILGDEISAVDLSIFSLLFVILDKAGSLGSSAVVSSFERLDDYRKRIAALPRIAAYIHR